MSLKVGTVTIGAHPQSGRKVCTALLGRVSSSPIGEAPDKKGGGSFHR